MPKTYLRAIQKQDLEAAFELLCDNRLPYGEIPLKYAYSWKIIETKTLDISGVEILETFVEISTKDQSELGWPPKVYSLQEIDAEDMRLLIENSEYELSPFEPQHYKSSGRCFSLISQVRNRD